LATPPRTFGIFYGCGPSPGRHRVRSHKAGPAWGAGGSARRAHYQGEMRMSASLRRLAPLTGIPFAILLAFTFFGSPSTPNVHDTGVQVIDHYNKHHTSHLIGDLAGGLAVIFFLFFITSLRSYFKDKEGADGLSMAAFAGGILIAVGGAIFTSIDVAQIDTRHHITPQAGPALDDNRR